jgi:hypothetical protein
LAEPTSDGKETAPDGPVNDARSRLYQRLMEAEDRIAHALYAQGVRHQVVEGALDAIDERLSEDDRREDLYLAALEHYVRALGGRLEVRALFADQVIVVRSASAEVDRH